MKRFKGVFKNLSYAFVGNLVSLIGSIFVTLLLPKFIGVTQYSHYQLYIFYASYAGFAGIGWVDGVYLRYGGKYYDELDKSLFATQLRAFSLLELIISTIVYIVTFFIADGPEKRIVFLYFCLCIIIYMPRTYLHNLLQATGRIKEYATGVIIDKTFHIAGTFLGILLQREGFIWFISSELIGRILGGLYIFYVSRDIVTAKVKPFYETKAEAIKNISAGVPLLISNLASMLITGVMRQAIEIFWDVETFGKVSLTLSISNLLLTFISSVSLVLFPMLKRNKTDELSNIYGKLRTGLMLPVLGCLIFYHPVKTILSIWLPQYAESLRYMAILFPICVFDTKMSLLINTYMKALRKEKTLLFVNLSTVGLSVVCAAITCWWMHSLDAAIFSIVTVLAFRSIFSEIILSKSIDIKMYKDIIFEIILTLLFTYSSWVIGGIFGMICYATGYVIYLIFKQNEIRGLVDFITK